MPPLRHYPQNGHPAPPASLTCPPKNQKSIFRRSEAGAEREICGQNGDSGLGGVKGGLLKGAFVPTFDSTVQDSTLRLRIRLIGQFRTCVFFSLFRTLWKEGKARVRAH
jgi:hypothetical protein